MMSDIEIRLQEKLDDVVKEIEAEGYDIRATWRDEYGGPQSVVSGVRITIEKKWSPDA